MHILRETYHDLFHNVPDCLPEFGGILGGKEGIVSRFFTDYGMQSEWMCAYIPNVDLLNRVITEWQEDDVEFYGLFHSHFYGVETLSAQDRSYIKEIHAHLPAEILEMSFPLLVFPEKKIINYVSHRRSGDYEITREPVVIVENQSLGGI